MIEQLYQQYLKHRAVSTDTRHIEKGAIFFALKGPNFNANAFAEEALAKGASIVVIDEEKYKTDDRCFLVPDVLQALQQLAIHHRKQLKIPVIGLTGSNGKTTTKELIKAVLSTKYKVIATAGNLNNHIGVPLTLLSIRPEHEIAIIEMGANHVGEIKDLSLIAQPSHGMITNIGKAHLEGFGGFEGVIRAKSELYDFLIKNEGKIFVNSQNDILRNMAKRMKKPLFYPAEGDYYHCEFIEASPFVKINAENGTAITTHLIGEYNFENIAAALCIAKFFDVESYKANQAIESYVPANNRSQIIKKDKLTIILDAYNANPSSMSSALENLNKMPGQPKVVILGSMKELGENSQQEHELIGKQLAKQALDSIYLLGQEFEAAKKYLPHAFHTNDKNTLKAALKESTFNSATVLIKGSRSMGLEDVVEDIN